MKLDKQSLWVKVAYIISRIVKSKGYVIFGTHIAKTELCMQEEREGGGGREREREREREQG